MKLVVSVDEARATATAALRRAGVCQAHAALQVDLLLEAELRGRSSHGLLRLLRVVERIDNGVTDPRAKGEYHWRGNFLEVNGLNGMGPVVTCAALDLLAERAREGGIAIGAVRHNNHLGMLAWYAERMARSGMILIALCNSEALVHPWGGRRAMLGTNPIAVGVPTGAEPFVMDMATSLVSMGQIHDYAIRGQPLPAGWALDANGHPTQDAQAAKQGSIAPFGQAKGYALGLAFEVLVGAITGSALGPQVRGTLDSEHPCNKGDVFIVIDPGADTGTARRLADYLDAVRASGGEDGPGVSVPGDRAMSCRRERLRDGLPLAEEVWRKICALAAVSVH